MYERRTEMNPKFHLSLDVQDLEQSIRFYSVLLNAPVTKHKPGYAKFDLESPAINLAMQEKAHCCLQGLSHMGLRVETPEEMQTAKQRLEAAGYKTVEEANTTCCYALQDKFWVADPTGYRWEVYMVKADVEQTDTASRQSSCCA
jgi:catechol 2,3-dioxygenase-like lactoylglutathione lyase family enzyme